MTTKICSVCGIKKELSEFHKDKHTKNGYAFRCKECQSARNKEWRSNNKEKISKQKKLYRENNKEYIRKKLKEWNENNKEYAKQRDKIYYERNKNNIMRRIYARRKSFGHNPLNEKFPGSVGHHINRNDVIYIPEEIHKSIVHKQGDKVSMNKINELAINFLCGDNCGCVSC